MQAIFNVSKLCIFVTTERQIWLYYSNGGEKNDRNLAAVSRNLV